MTDRLFLVNNRPRLPATALNTGSILMPDRPASLFRFGDHRHTERSRVIASVIESGGTDREAWAALVEASKGRVTEEAKNVGIDHPRQLRLVEVA